MKLAMSEHSIDVLTALEFKGIGNAWVVKHLDRPQQKHTLVTTLNRFHKEGREVSAAEFERRREHVREQVERALSGVANGVTTLGDPDFPPFRGDVPAGDQPVALFYRGDLSLIGPANTNVAVIGLLDPDPATLDDEAMIVSEFVKRNCVVVSGLAQGCDAQAHRVALDLRGKTAAILPNTLRNVLPKAHIPLAAEIEAKGGLLVTEYYKEFASHMELRSRYERRDRLQALFSDLIVLASSYAKNDQGQDSGARLAMGYARKYGLPRAVMPDRTPGGANPKYDLNREVAIADKTVAEVDPIFVREMQLNRQIRRRVIKQQSQFELF